MRTFTGLGLWVALVWAAPAQAGVASAMKGYWGVSTKTDAYVCDSQASFFRSIAEQRNGWVQVTVTGGPQTPKTVNKYKPSGGPVAGSPNNFRIRDVDTNQEIYIETQALGTDGRPAQVKWMAVKADGTAGFTVYMRRCG